MLRLDCAGRVLSWRRFQVVSVPAPGNFSESPGSECGARPIDSSRQGVALNCNATDYDSCENTSPPATYSDINTQLRKSIVMDHKQEKDMRQPDLSECPEPRCD
jgi:hypothetical protein